MRWVALAGVAVFVCACSSSSSDTTPSKKDAGDGDSGQADSGSDSGLDAGLPNQCGDAPYVQLQLTAVSYTTKKPVPNVQGSFDLCPGKTFVSDANGVFDFYITKDAPFEARAEANGFVTVRSGLVSASTDQNLGATALFPTALSGLFPHLSPTSTDILVETLLPSGTQADGGDPCSTKDGIVYAVKNHPEATVVYYGGTSAAPNPDPSLTATGSIGAAEISGLAATSAGSYVELSASKPGCPALSFVSYPHLGKYGLENGVLTVAGAFTSPVPAP